MTVILLEMPSNVIFMSVKPKIDCFHAWTKVFFNFCWGWSNGDDHPTQFFKRNRYIRDSTFNSFPFFLNSSRLISNISRIHRENFEFSFGIHLKNYWMFLLTITISFPSHKVFLSCLPNSLFSLFFLLAI